MAAADGPAHQDRADFRAAAGWRELQQRARIRRKIRQFFDDLDFVEVETPVLSADSVVDRHIDPLSVTLFDDPQIPTAGRQLWLQSSPEFGMKRLLASGAKRIYQFSHAFRGGEVGRLHNPEFTIVEWYRVGDGYEQGMDLLSNLSQAIIPEGEPGRLSYADAFQQFVGPNPHYASVDDLRDAARSMKKSCPFDACEGTLDDWQHWLWAECVEPQLGAEKPTIVFDYPESQAALARVRSGDPCVAERFELYVRGIELANGYHELTDGEELRRRVQKANQERAAENKYRLPGESRLAEAMLQQQLPACSGTALGFDRLVMLLLGKSSLDEVIAFPIDRA